MAGCLIQSYKSIFSIPVFLAPAFSTTAPLSAAKSFSTSTTVYTQVKRGIRDKNRKRGVSAIRGTGPRRPLKFVTPDTLPKPVSNPTEARAAFEVDPDHGLWGFFTENKESIIPPAEEDAHGRAWTVQELSRRDWTDLHKLYWITVKELNIVRTRENERQRLRLGYGRAEAEDRIKILARTMHRIRQTLAERHYAHFDARQLIDDKNLYELFPDLLIDKVEVKERKMKPEAAKKRRSNKNAQSTRRAATGPETMKDKPDSNDNSQRQKLGE